MQPLVLISILLAPCAVPSMIYTVGIGKCTHLDVDDDEILLIIVCRHVFCLGCYANQQLLSKPPVARQPLVPMDVFCVPYVTHSMI